MNFPSKIRIRQSRMNSGSGWAEINLQSGQTDEALARLLDFVQQSSNEYLRSEAHYYLGSIFEERNQYEEAIPQFVQVIEEYPGSERFPGRISSAWRNIPAKRAPTGSARSFFGISNPTVTGTRAL